MTTLSQAALDICSENYAKNCGGCPLRQECVSNIGPGYEGLQRWQDKVNEAAEKIKGEIEDVQTNSHHC